MILFLFQNKCKLFFKIICLLLSLFLILTFKQFQNIGEIKYYGNDYTLLNIFNPVKNILNDRNCNLNYADSNIDLNNINKVTPLNIIKEYGMDGYRSFNQNAGRMDFNQSGLDIKTSKRAINSAYNLYLHNIQLYLKTQINYLLSAFKIPFKFSEPIYFGEHSKIKMFSFDLWQVEKINMLNQFLINNWNNYIVRRFISKVLMKMHNIHIKLFMPIMFLIFIFLVMINFYFSYKFILSIILINQMLLCGIISSTLLLLLFGVFLFMPAGRVNYLYPFYFGSLINLIYFIRGKDSTIY